MIRKIIFVVILLGVAPMAEVQAHKTEVILHPKTNYESVITIDHDDLAKNHPESMARCNPNGHPACF